MVQITFSLDKDNISQIVVFGHTGFAKNGFDIICAGLSGQVAMLEIGVLEYRDSSIHIEKREGFFSVKQSNDSYKENIQILFRSFYLTALVMEKTYSNFIKVEIINLGV